MRFVSPARRSRALSCVLLTSAAVFGAVTAAQAAVTISTDPTSNMTCTGGVCSPAAKKANLNVTDLANLLAAGDTKVVSDSAAKDIEFKAPLSWTSTSRLTLDAYRSIVFQQPIAVAGTGALTIATNDGGSGGDFSFTGKGHVEFWSLSSSLTINTSAYTLVGDIGQLASEIAGTPAGKFALAHDYDSSADGTYEASPVQTTFDGTFEGLGNHIDRLTVKGHAIDNFGLFYYLNANGLIRDIGLTHVNVSGPEFSDVAALVPISKGPIINSYATGKLKAGPNSYVGGLVADENGSITGSHADVFASAGDGSLIGGVAAIIYNGDLIDDCYSTEQVVGEGDSFVGGIVGFIDGTVSRSFSAANVQGDNSAGGLVGNNSGAVVQSYARGAVSGSGQVGGLIGGTGSITTQSYSTGLVSGGLYAGGLVGYDNYSNGFDETYWDLGTSGVSDPSHGAGNIVNDPGISGLDTAGLTSSLPKGFDPKVWAQKPNISNGYPYLRANPPPKK